MSKNKHTKEQENEQENEQTKHQVEVEQHTLNEVSKLKEEYEQRIKELEDRALRIQAEAQNYKRRKEEESDRMIKYANEHLIEQILPVLDNFERAISLDDQNLNDELSKFLEGFKMVYGSLISILDNLEVKEIISLDQPFDPVYHQAVLTDRDESKEDGIILEVLQKGYMLKDKVIRPTLVKVNNI